MQTDAIHKNSIQTPAAGFLSDAEQTLPERIAKLAALHPQRVAIGSGAWQATYPELNTTANALAHEIIFHGGAPRDRVALLMRHDGPQIAAALATLKAGRVVVSLNPGDPPARLKQVLADAEPTLIIADSANEPLARQIAESKIEMLLFTDPHRAAAPPRIKIAPGDLAFLVYTSGSTGKPKGVMQTHRNILHNALRLSRGMKLRDDDRILWLASLSGGQGLSTGGCALFNGAALCPFPAMEKGVVGLAGFIAKHRINVFVSSASLFRHFLKTLAEGQRLPGVRAVRLGGELATAEDFATFQKHFSPDCILFHSFSTSETGNISQCPLSARDKITATRLPLGHAAEGVQLLVADETGREMRGGGAGEIIVKSHYISPGYWRNEQLTAEKFSEASDGSRVYHTGDLGRLDANGALLHAGRKDAQIKVRGYRIEPLEIEDAIAALPEVERAVICAQISDRADAQLIAHVVPRAGKNCSAETLRNSLRAVLPGYMVPGAFVFHDHLPLTPQGKINREQLRQKAPPAFRDASIEPPETAAEILLAEIWKQVFKRDAISRRDNFFDLGGDSLNAAVIAAKIFDAANVELPLRAFTDYPTVAELAAAMEKWRANEKKSKPSQLIRAARGGPLPMSFEQERIWRHATKSKKNSDQYTVATAYRLRGALDAGILHECLDSLVRRHEMLRTTFDEIGGKPAQIIHSTAPLPLPGFDFSGAPDAEEKATRLFQNEARQPFDLKRGPLIRFALAKIRADEHWLLSAAHHIILDAWSWKIFFQELAALYEACQRGETLPSEKSGLPQYADYAVWQHETLRVEHPAFRETIAWWRERSARGKPRPTKLPLRRLLRRSGVNPADGLIWWGVDPATSQRLDQIGRETRATFYMTRLAVFAACAAAESRREDLAFGTYATNRNRIELQNMFGLFANLTVLRMDCDLAKPFREWLGTVRDTVLETQSRAEIPYEMVCDELRASGVEPIKFRVIFGVSDHTAPLRFGGLELSWLERRMETMPSGFTLTFDQHNEAHRCWTAFDAGIYSPEKVRAFIARLQRLLDVASVNPNLPLAELVR